jgi:galacturonosyltransferase 12/13/14/15
MQIRLSPSMRSITISTSHGLLDFMRSKTAARHFSYRTVFHTVLILAFLLPFVFILTAVMTLDGFNKCSSLGNCCCCVLFLVEIEMSPSIPEMMWGQ